MTGTMVECQTCTWEGEEDELVAPRSDLEPGCPSCGGTDFLDVDTEPHPNINEDDWREER